MIVEKYQCLMCCSIITMRVQCRFEVYSLLVLATTVIIGTCMCAEIPYICINSSTSLPSNSYRCLISSSCCTANLGIVLYCIYSTNPPNQWDTASCKHLLYQYDLWQVFFGLLRCWSKGLIKHWFHINMRKWNNLIHL